MPVANSRCLPQACAAERLSTSDYAPGEMSESGWSPYEVHAAASPW